MTISWQKYTPSVTSFPADFAPPSGYLAPAQIYLSALKDTQMSEDLQKLAQEILEDPFSMVEFTEVVYNLMQQDLQIQSDRFGYK